KARHVEHSANGSSPRQEQIDAIAARWVVRLDGERPLSARERRRLDRWLAADAAHVAAFDLARARWKQAAALRRTPSRPGAAHAVPTQRASLWRTRHVPEFAFVAMLAALCAGVLWFGDPISAVTADYASDPGETKTVTLPDGSRVALGPASSIA